MIAFVWTAIYHDAACREGGCRLLCHFCKIYHCREPTICRVLTNQQINILLPRALSHHHRGKIFCLSTAAEEKHG